MAVTEFPKHPVPGELFVALMKAHIAFFKITPANRHPLSAATEASWLRLCDARVASIITYGV